MLPHVDSGGRGMTAGVRQALPLVSDEGLEHPNMDGRGLGIMGEDACSWTGLMEGEEEGATS